MELMKLALVDLLRVLVFIHLTNIYIRIINNYYLLYHYHVPGTVLNIFYALTHSVHLPAH